MDIISVEHLVRHYEKFIAVNGISFGVRQGEIFGFLGPNGAGKTTTISVLCTILRPTAGTASVGGFDVSREPMKVREQIGIIFQDPSLDDRLTAFENLDFHARIYAVPGSERKKRIDEVLDMVELADRKKSLVKTFSGGMKRRLEIARGLIHHPRVLFLDEPTLGLDPQTRRHIWEYLRRLRDEKGVTLFLTTHYMDEAENCDRIAIIDHGDIKALDSPAGLKHMVGGDVITLESPDENEPAQSDAIAGEVKKRYGLDPVMENGSVSFEVQAGEEFLPGLLREFPLAIGAVNLRRPTLDDVFVKLTGRAIRDQDADAKDRMRQNMRAWKSRRRG